SILSHGGCDCTVLHCVSLYPLEERDMNLSRMCYLFSRFGFPVGFSDHSKDINGAVASVFMGASVIEKHFTLGGDFRCPDENVSIDPDTMRRLVSEIARARTMMGCGTVSFSDKEGVVAKSARRSLYARHDIEKGTVLTSGDIIEKRPGTGIPADKIYEYIGKRTSKNIPRDYLLRDEFFE
ncbi:MAG: N-acetylneuraminate synthase family protein, partial [Spirochaetota bacterium]